MAPRRIAGVTFKETSDLCMHHREAVFVPGKSVEIYGVRRTVDIRAERFENVAGGVELAGVNKDAISPADRGVHVRNVEFGHGAFVKYRAEAVAILNAGEIDDGADTRVEAEAEAPVLPTDFVALAME